jgi:putative peptidoglycan lipid II flippase
MSSDARPSFVGHARTVALLTLLSRMSGLVRDAVASRAFGASLVWSAFVTAFVIPNLFRRLFGEGALSAAFIPAYTQAREDDPAQAARLASLTLLLTSALLWAIVIVVEIVLASLLIAASLSDGGRLLALLTMIMLPYMPLVCATALLGGMLQVHDRFVPHAASPVLLNLCMIGAAVWFALLPESPDLRAGAIAVASAVVIAGVLQVTWCAWSLRKEVRWTRDVAPARDAGVEMVRKLGPVIVGLGALQLSSLIDAMIAGLPLAIGTTLTLGERTITYPLDEASASVLFFGQRLYQFPLGVFGIAIATAVFPALARTARNAGDFAQTIRHGVRASLFISIPATVGLVLIREPLIGVIYLGGDFTEADAARVSSVLLGYALAVWAYSLTHVLTRAFYAAGRTGDPMRTGLIAVCINLALNVSLIWWLGESGLAWATSIAAMAQTLMLAWLLRTKLALRGVFDRDLVVSVASSVAIALVMGGALIAMQAVWEIAGETWGGSLLRLLRDTTVGALVYLLASRVLARPEVAWLLNRRV